MTTSGPGIRWERSLPCPELSNVVHHYEWLVIHKPLNPIEITIFPGFATGFVFCFYRNQKIRATLADKNTYELPETLFLSPCTGPIQNSQFQEVIVLRCILLPGVFYRLFHIPLNHTTNKPLDLSLHVDAEFTQLYERFQENLNRNSCIEILEQFLIQRCSYNNDSELYFHAQEIIGKYKYQISIKQLAEALGISQRHLNRLMNNQFGFPSKHFLRTYRFGQALKTMQDSSAVSLTHIAQQFGYYDQAHFNHEFKMLGGTSPKSFLAQIGIIEYYDIGESFPHAHIQPGY